MSFCALRDHPSQWQTYGDKGNGIAIGFDTQALKGCFHFPLNFMWLDYDEDDIIERITDSLEDFFKEYLRLKKSVLFKSEKSFIDWGKNLLIIRGKTKSVKI